MCRYLEKHTGWCVDRMIGSSSLITIHFIKDVEDLLKITKDSPVVEIVLLKTLTLETPSLYIKYM